MKHKIFLSILSLFFIFNTSCAEEPRAPLKSQTDGQGALSGGEEDHLELMSLIYEGKTASFDNPEDCNFNLSIVEEAESGEHHHELIILPDYTDSADGAKMKNVAHAEFVLFNPSDKKYYKIDHTPSAGMRPILISLLLRGENKDGVIDYNKLKDPAYKQGVEQVLKFQLNMSIDEVSAFENAMEETLEDKGKLQIHKSLLNKISALDGEYYHAAAKHFHKVKCTSFNLEKVGMVEFESETGDDHKHGDGHKH